jgi:hypothetical protein
MRNNDAIGSKQAERSDWSRAWELVSRLAAARAAAIDEIDRGEPAVAAPVPHPQRRPPAATEAIDPDQLTRAIAEIEHASATLRRAEPTLEAWTPEAAARGEKRRHRSVWILIGGVWLSASLVVAGATGAILYLFG